jgi:cobalt-zinc-cadmium efflux system membrane fusion protein
VRFDPASPQLERLHVVPVTAATLAVDELDLPGTVEAMPTRLVKLALPTTGRVRQVLVTLGDHVKSGQTLLTLETPDSSTLLAALRQAHADVKSRQATVAKAQADLSRARDLLENRAIAQKEVLAAETVLAEATAGLEQAHATQDDVTQRLQLLGVDTSGHSSALAIHSPMDGDVIDISVAPGEYRTDTAAPVLSIADLARVWVVAAVPERSLGAVREGAKVTITLSAYPNRTFEGTVSRLSDTLDPETRTAKLIVELENPGHLLKPEMFARVRYAGSPKSVVRVPIGAVIQDEGRTSVFIERARGEFERRSVTLGPRNDNEVIVTSGLTPGDRVVDGGTMLLMGQ